MGKFDGVLIASDFDNTMVYTEGALRSGGPVPAISRENRDAIEYFMAQGGTFSVATGRALPSFASVMDGVPMNGPTVLFNGAAIYDFPAGRYLRTAFLPECIRDHVRQLSQLMPGLTFEIYHDDNSIHVVNPNEITARHLHLTHTPSQQIDSLDQAPSPIAKLLFEEEPQRLRQLEETIRAQDWSREYEVVASAVNLLEITARGANKGGMVRRLAELPISSPSSLKQACGRRMSAAWGTMPTTSPCWNTPAWPSPRKTPFRRCTGCRGSTSCRTAGKTPWPP